MILAYEVLIAVGVGVVIGVVIGLLIAIIGYFIYNMYQAFWY